MAARYSIKSLAAHHNRQNFSCGNPALDRYIKEQASQDVRRHIASCYVAVEDEDAPTAGFYTLSASGIAISSLPPAQIKKFPRYPLVPAALVGRLAVALDAQGTGLGAALLYDAIARAIKSEMGVYSIVVEAADERAKRFYERFQFEAVSDNPLRLVLPVATALATFDLK